MPQEYRIETFRAGQTLHEWCSDNPAYFQYPMMVFHNDFPIPRSKWADIVLTDTDVITLGEIVQGGGGGDGSQMVAMIVIMVVAVVVTYGVAAAYTGPALFGMTAAQTGMMVGAMAGAMVTIAGNFAMSMMFSTNPANASYDLPSSVNSAKAADGASPTYSLSAQNNSARLNQMIPESFGTNLQTLDLGAKPYSRFSGGEEYLQMLMVVGMGEYDIKQVYIEDTSIWKDGSATGNFPEVEMEIINPGEKVTLFKPNVETASEVSGQQFEDDGDSLGFFAVSPPNVEVDELELSFVLILAKPEPTTTEQKTAQDGSTINETTGGGLSAVSMTIKTEAVEIDDIGNEIGNPFVILNKTYSYASYDSNRITETIPVTLGRYAVKTTRVSTSYTPNENDPDNIADQIRDQFYWSSAAGFVPEELTFNEGTMIAVRARASNALNQQVSRQFKALHQRKLPLWSNGEWSDLTATNSSAAAICYLLKSKYGAKLSDQYIDLDTLWAIDAELQAKGYGVSGIFDSTVNVRSALADMCSVSQIVIRLSSSGITFIMDKQRSDIAYSFDETNTLSGSFRYDTKFANNTTIPDWLSFDYFDPDTGYTLQTVPCKMDDAKNVQPTNKRMYAVDRTQAFYEGMRELMAYRYRQKYITFSTGIEGFRRNFGDRVKVSNLTVDYSKRPSVGEVSDVIDKYTLELDRPVIYDTGEEHLISFVKKDGTLWGPVKVDSVAISVNYTLISMNQNDYDGVETEQGDFTPITGFNVTRTRFNLHTGVRKSDTVYLIEINPVDKNQIELGGFIDDDRVYTVESYTVPVLDPIDEVTKTTEVEQLSISTTWENGGVMVNASWSPVNNAQYYIVEWSSDNLNWTQAGKPSGTVFNFFVNTAQVFYIRVAAMLEFLGPWSVWSGTGVEGAPSAPELTITGYTDDKLNIDWDNVEQAADYVVTVKNGNVTTETAIVVQSEYDATIVSRNMGVYAQSRNSYGLSNFAYLSGSLPVPAAVTNLTQPNPAEWTVTWDASSATALTGYIAMIGNASGFDEIDALEVLSVTDPTATFTSLPAGTYYVKVAAKDVAYDVLDDNLNWSEIEI